MIYDGYAEAMESDSVIDEKGRWVLRDDYDLHREIAEVAHRAAYRDSFWLGFKVGVLILSLWVLVAWLVGGRG